MGGDEGMKKKREKQEGDFPGEKKRKKAYRSFRVSDSRLVGKNKKLARVPGVEPRSLDSKSRVLNHYTIPPKAQVNRGFLFHKID